MKRWLILIIIILAQAAFASTVTQGVSTASTSNTTSYASGSFTPAANDLLVAFVVASGTVATGTMTDSQSLGFTKVGSVVYAASANTIYVFVAKKLAAASSMTVTFDCTGDAATGAIVEVMRVSGMTLTGAAAVRQLASQANQTSGTPAPAFSANASTGNPTLGVVGNGVNPATITQPTSWTEQTDTGYATPTTGAEAVSRDSGFTSQTITWGSTAGSTFGDIIVELDTASPSTPVVVQHIEGPSNGDGTDFHFTASSPYVLPFSVKTTQNNTILVGFTYGSSDAIGSVADDTSDTFTQVANLYDATNNQQVWIYCAKNIAGGATHVSISPSGANAEAFMQAAILEVSNLTCATDGSTTATGATTSMVAGSITTTTNNDFLYQLSVNDGTGSFPSGVTVGASPWKLGGVDRLFGWADQFQVQSTAGAINPTFTEGAATRWVTAAVALSPTTTGAGPNSFAIINNQHINTTDESSTSYTFQCPFHGNLLVVDIVSSNNSGTTALSDGTNTFTQIGSGAASANSSDHRFYAKNLTATDNEVITATASSGTGHGRTVFCYDIQGADTSAPLDTSFGTSGLATATGTGPTTASGNFDTITATPGGQNEIVLVSGGIAFGSFTAVTSPANALYLAATGFTAEINPSIFDENNFWGVYYNGTDTTSETWHLAYNFAPAGTGSGDWVVTGSAFKAPSGAPSGHNSQLPTLGVGQP